MPLFTDGTIQNPSAGLVAATQVLTAGGTLSQVANAVLNNDPPPNGGTAEPAIVQAGVRAPNANDDPTKHNAYIACLFILGAGIALWYVSR